MGNYTNDSRIVLTLDAGGTNMVFGAMKGEEYVGEPITLPSRSRCPPMPMTWTCA